LIFKLDDGHTSTGLGVIMSEFSSFFDGEAVSIFCKRTHPKSLSWEERDFSPSSLRKRKGKGG
jgi:hypothetical protein